MATGKSSVRRRRRPPHSAIESSLTQLPCSLLTNSTSRRPSDPMQPAPASLVMASRCTATAHETRRFDLSTGLHFAVATSTWSPDPNLRLSKFFGASLMAPGCRRVRFTVGRDVEIFAVAVFAGAVAATATEATVASGSGARVFYRRASYSFSVARFDAFTAVDRFLGCAFRIELLAHIVGLRAISSAGVMWREAENCNSNCTGAQANGHM